MSGYLGLLVGALGVGLAVAPLLRRNPAAASMESDEQDAFSELGIRKAAIYENILDLDFEYAMGKLTDADYREIREVLLQDAAIVNKELDVVSRDAALDRWIEAEIRTRLSGPTSAAACPGCGAALASEARFCDRCGVAVADLACAGCGSPQRPGASYCGKCGAKL